MLSNRGFNLNSKYSAPMYNSNINHILDLLTPTSNGLLFCCCLYHNYPLLYITLYLSIFFTWERCSARLTIKLVCSSALTSLPSFYPSIHPSIHLYNSLSICQLYLGALFSPSNHEASLFSGSPSFYPSVYP